MLFLSFIQMVHDLLGKSGFDPYKWQIRSLDTVDSTNDKVTDLFQWYDQIVVLAKIQTQGRGREGRAWYSPEGGIWLSIGMNKKFTVTELSTPIVQKLNQVLSQYVRCEIKKPNDILIDGRKVGGVLVEGNIKGNKLTKVVVGIGINYQNVLPKELENLATKLDLHSKNLPYINDLAAEITVAVIEELNKFLER